MPVTEEVTACMVAPMMNAASARRTTLLRPRESASIPDRGETRSAKSAVADVMRDLSRVVNGCPRELWIETRVAEITPVSSVRKHVRSHCRNGKKIRTAKQQTADSSGNCEQPDENAWMAEVLLKAQRYVAEIYFVATFVVRLVTHQWLLCIRHCLQCYRFDRRCEVGYMALEAIN